MAAADVGDGNRRHADAPSLCLRRGGIFQDDDCCRGAGGCGKDRNESNRLISKTPLRDVHLSVGALHQPVSISETAIIE